MDLGHEPAGIPATAVGPREALPGMETPSGRPSRAHSNRLRIRRHVRRAGGRRHRRQPLRADEHLGLIGSESRTSSRAPAMGGREARCSGDAYVEGCGPPMAATSTDRRRPETSGLCLALMEMGLWYTARAGVLTLGGNRPPVPQSDELKSFRSRPSPVVAAASRLPQDMEAATIEPVLVNTYNWSTDLASSGAATVSPHFDLGELWCIGIGSVGSCALFFLGLVTRAFSRRPRRPRFGRGRECQALGLVYITGRARRGTQGQSRGALAERGRCSTD